MTSWGSSRSHVHSSERGSDDRSPGSVSWQTRVNDSARNSSVGSTNQGSRHVDDRDDDSASQMYDEKGEWSVTKGHARPPVSRRFTTGTYRDELRDRKNVGRKSSGGASNNNAVVVSKNFIIFVAAGLGFFGLSVLSAGRSNKAFERHFQEIAKVRADRRRLREENEALALENAKLRARIGGGSYSSYSQSGYGNGAYDDKYQPSLVQEVSAVPVCFRGARALSRCVGASAWVMAEPPARAPHDQRLPIDRLLAGGAAGALSRVTTAPIDRVKLLIQVNASGVNAVMGGGVTTPKIPSSVAWHVASRIAQTEGIGALWRGTGAAVVRILPYSATTFAVFPWYQAMALRAFGISEHDTSEGAQIAARFTAGAMAGTTATVLTYPLDLLHARVSAHTPINTGTAPGVVNDGVHEMKKNSGGSMLAQYRNAIARGGVRSLYAGLGPTLVGIVPYGGVSFATFESIKALYKVRRVAGKDGRVNAHRDDDDELNDQMPTFHKLAAGAFAGFLAQTATYPLHVVRRRMQVHGQSRGSANASGTTRYSSMMQGLIHIYRNEGVANGLFKGVGLTWVKGPIAAAVGFTANDYLQSNVPKFRSKVWESIVGDTHTNSSSPEPGLPKGKPLPPATYIEAKQSTAVESLVAGGIAGAIAKSAIAPADRVKIIFQVDKGRKFSVSNALEMGKDIAKEEGIIGLWRGNGVMMARVVPYAGVSFFSYPRYEAMAREAVDAMFGQPPLDLSADADHLPTNSGVGTRFIAGSLAGATATAITYPLDLMRARYAAAGAVMVDGKTNNKNASSLLKDVLRIVRKEGPKGLYGGITPTLVGIVPYAGISFATFETLKSRYKDSPDADDAEMPVATRLFFGGLAGLFAQSVTYPLDIVRRRIQVVGKQGGYTSPVKTLNLILKQEGVVNGLYKGVTMNWIKGPLSVGVSFFVNDAVKAYFRQHRGDWD